MIVFAPLSSYEVRFWKIADKKHFENLTFSHLSRWLARREQLSKITGWKYMFKRLFLYVYQKCGDYFELFTSFKEHVFLFLNIFAAKLFFFIIISSLFNPLTDSQVLKISVATCIGCQMNFFLQRRLLHLRMHYTRWENWKYLFYNFRNVSGLFVR